MSNENDAIWQAAKEYFEHAGSDRNENIRFARPSIDRWGTAFVLGCFTWIVWRIEKEVADTQGLPISDTLFNLRIFMAAKVSLAKLADVVSTFGKDAGNHLVRDIGVSTDEDITALIAYMLADEFITTFDPRQREFSRIFLENTYKQIQGSSCKMALAWALYNMGSKKYWETIVYSDSVWVKEIVQMWEEIIRELKPNLKSEETKSLVCRMLAVPEKSKSEISLPVPGPEMGVIEILALDIASDGRAFSPNPKWKWNRKTRR